MVEVMRQKGFSPKTILTSSAVGKSFGPITCLNSATRLHQRTGTLSDSYNNYDFTTRLDFE